VGNAQPGEMRKSASVDQDGHSLNDGTTGMGWFPGYAIDLESGARCYMAFGENSFLISDDGADMVWNPSERITDGAGVPIMGGVQPVYIMSYKNKTINGYALSADYDAYGKGVSDTYAGNAVYQDMLLIEGNDNTVKRDFYSCVSWIYYPKRTDNQEHMATDVTIKVRMSKEYNNFTASGANSGTPMYSWNMDDIATDLGSGDRLVDALDMINVVPNPYYAYSDYERNRLDTKVKITNLPERCTVKIYSTNGKLVKTFKKDSPVTSLDWDLNNHKGIAVAGGVYLIHVDVPPGVDGGGGEKVIKFFGGMRQVDLHGI
jgi:hypothetical protein